MWSTFKHQEQSLFIETLISEEVVIIREKVKDSSIINRIDEPKEEKSNSPSISKWFFIFLQIILD